MTLTQQQLQTLQEYTAEQEQQKQPVPDFGVPEPPKAKSPEEQLSSMPNADKLTGTERSIYGALPGVTKWMENSLIMGGTVSEQ